MTEPKASRSTRARAPMGTRDYLPDHAAERRDEYRSSTPAQRLAEAISLSRSVTRLAAAGAAARERR